MQKVSSRCLRNLSSKIWCVSSARFLWRLGSSGSISPTILCAPFFTIAVNPPKVQGDEMERSMLFFSDMSVSMRSP